MQGVEWRSSHFAGSTLQALRSSNKSYKRLDKQGVVFQLCTVVKVLDMKAICHIDGFDKLIFDFIFH